MGFRLNCLIKNVTQSMIEKGSLTHNGCYPIKGAKRRAIELRKSNGTLSILLDPPHPPLSPDYGGEDKGEGDLM
jgi:hypothetical protein